MEASVTLGSDVSWPLILTYHKIGRLFDLGITTVGRSRFSAHLDLIARLGLEFACASEIALGSSKKGVALTFDDGYESVCTEALPEMEGRGIRGTVFPVVSHLNGLNTWDVRLSPRRFRHLSWSQLGGLIRAGFELGSHTLSHRDLTRLQKRELRAELRGSKKLLEDRMGVAVTAISYPFGRYSARVTEEALQAGYTCGFASSPQGGFDRMAVGRMSVYCLDGAGSMRRKLGMAPGYRLESLKNRVVAALSRGTTIVKR
jgi:peptidoglycan/xylan/chitin deacetylase (PgdA/CDA1 family)